ncbi:MAG: helix-turn-helix transcriptional regulator, partial [Myxococcaceae bacterium]
LFGLKQTAFLRSPESSAGLLTSSERFSFLNQLGMIHSDLESVRLSKRELDCVRLKLQQKTALEISEELGLSVRTIEHYLENLKIKLGSKDKRDFSDKIEQLRLLGRV